MPDPTKAQISAARPLIWADILGVIFTDSAQREIAEDAIGALAPGGGGGGGSAEDVEFTPAGSIAATDVQAMGEELDADIGVVAAAAAAAQADADTAQSTADNHIADATAAHAATAISAAAAGNLSGSTVQAQLEELDAEKSGTAHTHAARFNQLAAVTSTVTLDGATVTTVETDLFSYTLPQGTVAAGDCIRISLWGNLLQNSGGNATVTLRFKVAGSTVVTFASGNITTGGTRRRWRLDIDLMIRVAASDSVALMTGWITGAAADGTAAGVNPLSMGESAVIATDYTSAGRALLVTSQFSVGTSQDIKLDGGQVVRLVA